MSNPDISGEWKNDLGSIMTLKVNGNDVSGTYKTAVGDSIAVGHDAPLKGTVQYPLISFIVDYKTSNDHCLTAWVGRFEDTGGKLTLKTMWLLGSLFSGPEDNPVPKEPWETFQINSDVFIHHT